MIMPEKLSLSDFINRRLHPVKLSIAVLRGEQQKSADGETTMVPTATLASVVETLSLFVEDYEKLVDKGPANRAGSGVERKFVGEEAKKI